MEVGRSPVVCNITRLSYLAQVVKDDGVVTSGLRLALQWIVEPGSALCTCRSEGRAALALPDAFLA